MDMKKLANTTEMMAMSFMTMLRAGPEVSLRGSPTVSPTTAAACAADFLPAYLHLRPSVATTPSSPSMIFLYLAGLVRCTSSSHSRMGTWRSAPPDTFTVWVRASSPLSAVAILRKRSWSPTPVPSLNSNQPLRPPFSVYFLALSQAPPVLLMLMASWTDDTMEPASRPETASTPKKKPTMMGDRITSRPGGIISRSDAWVAMSMHLR
mmetsp:Transcript_53394/g.141553  ORF Transcript_53394/g.141553 Transcript_53394/m.141553 type:complete len:208 (-) Transcript_53394:2102-2725(-)